MIVLTSGRLKFFIRAYESFLRWKKRFSWGGTPDKVITTENRSTVRNGSTVADMNSPNLLFIDTASIENEYVHNAARSMGWSGRTSICTRAWPCCFFKRDRASISEKSVERSSSLYPVLFVNWTSPLPWCRPDKPMCGLALSQTAQKDCTSLWLDRWVANNYS